MTITQTIFATIGAITVSKWICNLFFYLDK